MRRLSCLSSRIKYYKAGMEQDKKLYELQIRIVDEQIDQVVYELYGLTEGASGIVEGEG
jgi:hypothetical protein